MLTWLQDRLSSRNGMVRKGAAAMLRLPKWGHRMAAHSGEYLATPPVFANSFPKSGTHLLVQLVSGLPNTTNYGAFLASMTSSFQFRERSADDASRQISKFAPGEIVRGHLFFHVQNAADLARKNAVHYFVYRDPRDVVVSEAHYLRDMNRWHRLAPYFRKLPSIEAAIALSITGLDSSVTRLDYPNIAARYARYQGWLNRDDCLAIRFEELTSDNGTAVLGQMAEFYRRRCNRAIDVETCAQSMMACVAPKKSHTFRSGKQGGWQREFTAEHRLLFDRVAGDLLIELGYEPSHEWAHQPLPQSV